jgi:hypothetical protein
MVVLLVVLLDLGLLGVVPDRDKLIELDLLSPCFALDEPRPD